MTEINDVLFAKQYKGAATPTELKIFSARMHETNRLIVEGKKYFPFPPPGIECSARLGAVWM